MVSPCESMRSTLASGAPGEILRVREVANELRVSRAHVNKAINGKRCSATR
jgi:hypothetical protein